MLDQTENKDNYSDEELLKLIVVNNNTHYFSILYDRYAKYVYNKCFTFINSEAEARDLTHDIFIKIFMNLKNFKGDSKLSTWIYSVAYNFCISHAKNKSKISGISDEIIENLLDDGVDLIDDGNDIEKHIDINDEDDTYNDRALFAINYAKLQELLKLLPIDDRAMLLMKYQDDLSIKEISEMLNLNQGAVKMRLHRAKKKILELREL